MNSSSHTVIGYLHTLLSRRHGANSTDGELLRRFVESRDEDALAALMQRHGPLVLGLAGRVVGDRQLAEDVFQATFLVLSRKAHTIRRPQSLSCWLHGVAHRLAVQARRSHLRCREREMYVRPSSPSTPLDELTAQELVSILDEELHKLPENQRAPMILCCLEGLSQEEAAKRLGCSAGAVRGRLERGRQRLRVRLEKRGLTLPAVFGGTLLIAGAVKAVPPMLVQATLQAALNGIGATPAAAALIEEAMRMMFVNKLKAIGAAVLLLALTGTGVGMMTRRPQAGKEIAPPVAASNDKPMSADRRVDRYGDPLPKGAMMRLGTLQRHAVKAQLAVTADGKSIVTVRAGMYVHIWDAATGKLRQRCQLPADSASESVLSSDGRWLLTGLSAGEDRLQLWDLQTGKHVRTLAMEGATNIWLAAFSADGKAIVAVGSAGKESRARAWESATGKVIFRKEIHEGETICRLAFTPEGKRLLAVVNPNPPYLLCWDAGSGRQLWRVKDFFPYAMVCTPDGKLLSSDKTPVLDLATGQFISSEKMPPADDAFVLRLALSPDGRTLFVSTVTKVIVWDRIHGKVVRTLAGGGEQIAVWPDGKSILTNTAALQRWDVDSGKPLYADTFAWGHTGEVDHLAWSADGRRLASDAKDGTLRLWDTVSGRPLRFQHDRKTMRLISNNEAMETGDNLVALSPDGRWLLSNALGEESLKAWDAATGKEIRSLAFPAREKKEGPRHLFRARISSDGARVVALLGSQSYLHIVGETEPPHKVVVWDAKTGRLLTCHPIGQTQSIGSAIAPDGRTVVSNGAVIDAATGKEMARLEGTRQDYGWQPVAFSRDGALVAGEFPRLGEMNGSKVNFPDGVRVWETATGKMVAHVKMDSWVAQLAFHPNNRFVVSNERDGIRIWDVLTGKLAVRRPMPERVPVAVTRGRVLAGCFAFAPDGRLATGHPDSTILVWDVPLPASKPQRLKAKELEALWADLAGAGAAKAWRAIWLLADAPQDALPFLRGRVKPYPTAPADVTRKLLADLDSDSFEVREAARRRLQKLGLQAEPALHAALQAKPSLEQKKRIEMILDSLRQTPQPPSAEELRQLRALIVLERIAAPEARRLLEEAAQGPPSAALTRQARAALASRLE